MKMTTGRYELEQSVHWLTFVWLGQTITIAPQRPAKARRFGPVATRRETAEMLMLQRGEG